MAKRKTHEEYVQEMSIINPNIDVIEEYINSDTKILHKCKIDGYEWYAYPTHMVRGHGCPVCSNRVIVAGVNDISTVRPDLIKYFPDQECAKLYTPGSGRRERLVCPFCGYEKHMLIQHLAATGFACPVCGDGVSYPNKFCRQVFKQLPVQNFQCEYRQSWTDRYIYDIYFEYNGTKYIVEVDGSQHFKDTSSLWQPFDITRQTDNIKTQLAINNGCVVIRIDCRKSEMQYIKNSILNSCLSDIFDLSNINWIDCEQSARNSVVFEVCNFYNTSENKQIRHIANKFGIAEPTVRSYLTRGANVGLCSYQSQTYKLPVVACHIADNITFSFDSVSMCSKELSVLYNIKIEEKGIHRTCRHEQDTYKGFIFKYKDGDAYA